MGYITTMSDPTNRPTADLIADIDASEAEIETGDLVPGSAVLANIEAAMERLAAKQRQEEPRRVQFGR